MRVDHAIQIDVSHLCQIAGLSRASFGHATDWFRVLE